MRSLTSTSILIAFNGETTQFFEPSTEPRQGNPFPPSSFVIYMSGLIGLINKYHSAMCGKISHTEEIPSMVTHTAFVDDVVIFGETSTRNVYNVLNILEWFCQGSRQRGFNGSKSQVLSFPWIHPSVKNILFNVKSIHAYWQQHHLLGILFL